MDLLYIGALVGVALLAVACSWLSAKIEQLIKRRQLQRERQEDLERRQQQAWDTLDRLASDRRQMERAMAALHEDTVRLLDLMNAPGPGSRPEPEPVRVGLHTPGDWFIHMQTTATCPGCGKGVQLRVQQEDADEVDLVGACLSCKTQVQLLFDKREHKVSSCRVIPGAAEEGGLQA